MRFLLVIIVIRRIYAFFCFLLFFPLLSFFLFLVFGGLCSWVRDDRLPPKVEDEGRSPRESWYSAVQVGTEQDMVNFGLCFPFPNMEEVEGFSKEVFDGFACVLDFDPEATCRCDSNAWFSFFGIKGPLLLATPEVDGVEKI